MPLPAPAIMRSSSAVSIVGLLTARVLLDHFDQVTLLERDQFPEQPTTPLLKFPIS